MFRLLYFFEDAEGVITSAYHYAKSNGVLSCVEDKDVECAKTWISKENVRAYINRIANVQGDIMFTIQDTDNVPFSYAICEVGK
jgi:hypothetical protein